MKSCAVMATTAVLSTIVLYLVFALMGASGEIRAACPASDNSIWCEGPLYMAGVLVGAFLVFVFFAGKRLEGGAQ